MEAAGSTSDEVTVKLGGSEAFVLSDALARWEADGTISSLDPAATRVLFDLAAVLEPTIDAAFSRDYAEYLRRARQEVLNA